MYGGGDLWAIVPAPEEGRDPGPEWNAVALRLNPKSGAVRSRVRVGLTAWSAAYGFGALWVTNYRDDRLARVDPFSGAVDSRKLPLGPERIVITGDGVWISHFTAETILRLDPLSLDTEDVIELGEPTPDFTVGDGSVWVAQPNSKRLLRYDALDGHLEATVRLPEQPWSVELAHGALWVAVGRGE